MPGLREHYQELPEPCGEYFRLHTDDFDEPALLAAHLEALPAGEQARAVGSLRADERLALYDALGGLYAEA